VDCQGFFCFSKRREMMMAGGTPSAPKGQTLLHPQAPQEQAGEEHDDRDKRHLSDCVHGLAIYRAETPLKKKPRYAIYTKPTGQPQLVLVSSDATRDHQLRARAWQVANEKARELVDRVGQP
jgi:hypothetical protein